MHERDEKGRNEWHNGLASHQRHSKVETLEKVNLQFFVLYYLIVTSIGVLFHYIHGIFKKGGVLIHVLGAMNESTWEHLKLAFWPLLFGALARYTLINTSNNFWFAVSLSLITAMVLIPVLYYRIRRVLKKEVTWVSISIYYIAVLAALYAEQFVTNAQIGTNDLGFLLIGVALALFVWFTIRPPRHYLFKDPITKKYGDIT